MSDQKALYTIVEGRKVAVFPGTVTMTVFGHTTTSLPGWTVTEEREKPMSESGQDQVRKLRKALLNSRGE